MRCGASGSATRRLARRPCFFFRRGRTGKRQNEIFFLRLTEMENLFHYGLSPEKTLARPDLDNSPAQFAAPLGAGPRGRYRPAPDLGDPDGIIRVSTARRDTLDGMDRLIERLESPRRRAAA